MEALFTLREWKQLPEGFPAQLVDGRLIRTASPGFDHQDVVGEIYRSLVEVVERRRVALGPTDVVLDRLDVLQPDVCILRAPPPPDAEGGGIPLLAFEILTPSSTTFDCTVKALKYLAAGVEEVWLVDLAEQSITVRTTDGGVPYRDAHEARSRALPEVRLVPRDLFSD